MTNPVNARNLSLSSYPLALQLGWLDFVLLFLLIFVFYQFIHGGKFDLKSFIRLRGFKQNILIIGPCSAGKTTLATRIATGKFFATVTSMEPYTVEVRIRNKKYNLTDFPGHTNLYHQLESYITKATYIILVVDSTKKESATNAANIAYNIITAYDLEKTKILCVANKNDQIISRPLDAVKRDFHCQLASLSLKCKFINRFEEWCTLSSKKGEIKPILNFIFSGPGSS